MSKPTAKAYLEGVRRAVLREGQLAAKVEALKARLDGVGAMDYSAVRVTASSDGAALERRVIMLQAAEEVYQEHADFTTGLIEQAAGMLRAMMAAGCPSTVCDELELYYLAGMTTREVAQAVHVSESRVKAHRREALQVSDEFVPHDAA